MSTHGERRSARLNDARFDWARSLRVRRRLVVAVTSTMVALIVVTVLPLVVPRGPVWGVAMFGVWAVALLGFVCGVAALKAGVRGVEELTRDQLDERQWQVRGEVYGSAYAILSALVVAVVAGAWVALGVFDVRPSAQAVSAVSLVLILAAVTTPTLVAGWRDRV